MSSSEIHSQIYSQSEGTNDESSNPVALQRIDKAFLFQEVSKVLNFEKGILFTIRELFVRPGKSIWTFIHEDRSHLVKPIMFLFVTSLIYTFAAQSLQFEESYISQIAEGQTTPAMDETTMGQFTKWMQGNYGYANLIMGIFVGYWTKLFFRKTGYNFFEILVLVFYATGAGMLIFTIFGIAEYLSGYRILYYGAFLAIIYFTWAVGSFFDSKKTWSYFKSFFAYLTGYLTFIILAAVVSVAIDLLILGKELG